MANVNLLGAWKIKLSDSYSQANPTFPANATLLIDAHSTKANAKTVSLLSPIILEPPTNPMHAEFTYEDEQNPSQVHVAHVHCFPASSPGAAGAVSAIIGGSLGGDPEDVAVWGGDDGP